MKFTTVLGEKTLLEKALQNLSLTPSKNGESKLSQKNRPLTVMVKIYSERCQFPALPWAHQRNMPKNQSLSWKKVADQLKGPRPLWKRALLGWGKGPFILQGQSPPSGKPLKRGCAVLSTGCCQCRRVVQRAFSSSCSGDSSNNVTPSKNHTV